MNAECVRALANSQHHIEQQLFDRWADAQFDGTLETIDRHVEIMASCAQAIIDAGQEDDKEDILDGIEWSACAVAATLQQLAALSPGRQNPLLLDAGTLLCDAVGQYLPFLPENVRQAILAGIEQTERHVDTSVTMLSLVEIQWQRWLLPQLSAHLVLSF